MAITKSRAAGLCLFCLLLTALEARADTNFATAITRGANYLVSSQNLDPGFGYWYEEGLTGEPVLGLTQAYRSQQNAGYLTSAQTGGSYVVYSEGQYNPGTTPHYSSAITGSGAYALEQLSERQANPASNEWRTELATFFSERRGNGTGTQDLINSLFQGGPLSYSLYDLARYTAAAYYVGATDASLFSNAIKTYLPTLTNADTGSPVLGLSASLWALAKTNMLSNTAFGDNLIKSDANYGSPFYQLTWNGLSAKVLSYQAPDGSFYNTFSRQNPDYTEVTAISTVALKAAYQQKPSLGYDQQIRSAQLALTGGLDSSGMAYQKLGDNTTVQANYLTGEVLEAMPDHTPTLKVYLTSTRVASGDYQVNVYAQILNGAAGEGLSDTSITIFSPTSAGVTVPKCDGDVETVWNSSLGSYLTIPATAKGSASPFPAICT